MMVIYLPKHGCFSLYDAQLFEQRPHLEAPQAVSLAFPCGYCRTGWNKRYKQLNKRMIPTNILGYLCWLGSYGF